MPVFTVHVHVHEGTVSSFKRPHAVINTVHVPSYGINTYRLHLTKLMISETME